MSSAKGDNVDFKQHLSANKITLVAKLCVIDIAPTLDMYAATDFDFAQAYYHWFHLIQPEPLPETMIGGNPLAYLHHKLGGWGSGGMGHIEPAALAEYEASRVRRVKDVVGNNSPFCTKELGCTARRKTRRATG